ncbi:NAD(P)/FAD-dependent oxidoreductase [Halorussus amylolyticus]|uniref:NAD(P)/FAD-dependent oxidoreductase n=1 Tax=Halorussus amylolyticus TaxID=1126242 RepID=UPI001053A908|nr:NAD(P)/FAD-dependent oxidoreductase [Halorussus amylolyticus]
MPEEPTEDESTKDEFTEYDVAIVGGGVAGLSAGVYTARHGLETAIFDGGGSILRRNAHLENVPGFPAGVNSRLFLDMLSDQAAQAGCTFRETTVTAVREAGDGFAIVTAAGESHRAAYVVAATKNATDYLEPLPGVELVDRGKTFVEIDDRGRTGKEGVYAAGRIAGKPHQTAVAAGHGTEVAVALLEDDDRPFYHDWVAPEGYFTGRDRDVPPGCEEIDEAERREREDESLEVMAEYFESPHDEKPEQHPSVASED